MRALAAVNAASVSTMHNSHWSSPVRANSKASYSSSLGWGLDTPNSYYPALGDHMPPKRDRHPGRRGGLQCPGLGDQVLQNGKPCQGDERTAPRDWDRAGCGKMTRVPVSELGLFR